MWWDRLSLHVSIWIGVFAIGWKLGGGGGGVPVEEVVEAVEPVEVVETVAELEWRRCGQYGLEYWEADNGFYNCIKKGSR